MTFYDHTGNDCFWYNIPSTLTAPSLPVGSDLVCQSLWGKSLCMYPCPFSDSESRTPPHRDVCRNSWVLVLQSNLNYPGNSDSESGDNKDEENCNANKTLKKAHSVVNSTECKSLSPGNCTTLKNCNVMQDCESKGEENVKTDETEVCYYLNKITGHSCWHPPEGWDSLVEDEWHGWILCVSEDSYCNHFWSVSMQDEMH